METFIRWAKFNLVGLLGMAVQLASLALFNRLLHGHYLLASAAALELTLLHNFVWHLRYTWRDRRTEAPWPNQLFRFHLANGLVSLAGNLVIMRLLVHRVHRVHLPLLAANAIAIVCCSLANFLLSHRWAFAPAESRKPTMLRARPTLALLLLFSDASQALSQQVPVPPPPSAPASQPAPAAPAVSRSYDDIWPAYAGLFCAAGASTSPAASKPAVGCGAGFTFVPLPLFVEVGVMGPQANRSYISGYLSLDANLPLARTSAHYFPIVIVGYSRLFETGHAFDYGIALVLPRAHGHEDDLTRIRLELRDYWTFANPTQHNIMLRVGWVSRVTD